MIHLKNLTAHSVIVHGDKCVIVTLLEATVSTAASSMLPSMSEVGQDQCNGSHPKNTTFLQA